MSRKQLAYTQIAAELGRRQTRTFWSLWKTKCGKDARRNAVWKMRTDAWRASFPGKRAQLWIAAWILADSWDGIISYFKTEISGRIFFVLSVQIVELLYIQQAKTKIGHKTIWPYFCSGYCAHLWFPDSYTTFWSKLIQIYKEWLSQSSWDTWYPSHPAGIRLIPSILVVAIK